MRRKRQDPSAGCLSGDISRWLQPCRLRREAASRTSWPAQRSRNVAALYVLDGGAWVSYIVGAPELMNRSLRRAVRRRRPRAHAADRQERWAGLSRPLRRRDAHRRCDATVAGVPAGRDRRGLQPRGVRGAAASGSLRHARTRTGPCGPLRPQMTGSGSRYIVGAPEFVNRSSSGSCSPTASPSAHAARRQARRALISRRRLRRGSQPTRGAGRLSKGGPESRLTERWGARPDRRDERQTESRGAPRPALSERV